MSKIIIGGHEVTAQKDYSTSEVFTGQYWIDGKKIYKRTFSSTATKSAGTNRDTYYLTINNFVCDTLIDGFGFYEATRSGIKRVSQIGSSAFSDDTARTPTEESIISYYPASQSVGVYVMCFNGFFTSVDKITFTVYYTKTE